MYGLHLKCGRSRLTAGKTQISWKWKASSMTIWHLEPVVSKASLSKAAEVSGIRGSYVLVDWQCRWLCGLLSKRRRLLQKLWTLQPVKIDVSVRKQSDVLKLSLHPLSRTGVGTWSIFYKKGMVKCVTMRKYNGILSNRKTAADISLIFRVLVRSFRGSKFQYGILYAHSR
jgi:hypothetical protein